ncbi:Zn-dependent alcohol dehydrogenase [Halieaceae bacterium IMCC14734]|uniref:Zn-dependent alcohol dehydrogenase n=1 Tax=Candidatus Litorirhabdus singularis TaxID=2518993 RepID=A0ABT3TDT8_9GAMM|nr:Zn-dependent alcohol dehydrogenase [Candidatus Litorirhabdus singularis]MCX2979622.1 Zn-dependent alcohol dehydrogenase [Candidatus Litorirhabdus singularis]
MKAVVVDAINEFSVQEVSLDAPKTGEVMVAIKATGICRSDLSVINGTIPMELPAVIGHEGAGIVQEVGPGVENVEVGDHVVLSFIPNCGTCFYCEHEQANLCSAKDNANGFMLDGTARVKRDGEDLRVMTLLGCMAERCVAPAISCVKIDKDIPLAAAALIGCGVMTGVGAVLNTAQVEAGSTVAVFGCGGIGLSIIQGARIAGAKQVIAVDTMDSKLEMAPGFGATHVVKGEDAQEFILEHTEQRGADYCFEAVGIGALMQQAEAATRPGGTCTVVGVGNMEDQFVLNPFTLPLFGKRVLGSMYGGCNPKRDFPRLLDFYRTGKLDLDGMITKTYSIDEAPQAFADLRSGLNARGVIVYD